MNDSAKTKSSRERSPSFPFIPLKTAITRLAEFEKEFSRHDTPANRAYLAWGMKGHTSQAGQTLGALKAFGLVDYKGSGDTRAVSISEQGRTYLRAQQEEIKREVLKKAALRPKWIAHFWPIWGNDRPPDPICLDALVLTHKFNAKSAPTFLKVYDETVDYAKLVTSDKVDPVTPTEDDEDEEMEPATQEHPTPRDERGPRRAPSSIFDQMVTAGLSTEELNRLKILVDGDKLQIAGQNVDLEGIGTLRKMLEKYEEILRLQKGEK